MGYLHRIRWPDTKDRRELMAAVGEADAFPLRRATALHRRLLLRNSVGPFAEPVPAEVEEYFAVIHTPMDLGTIQARLESGAVQSLLEYADLVRRVFTNARVFNRPGSQLHSASLRLEAWFNNEICILARMQTQ